MRALAMATVFLLGTVAHAQTRSMDDVRWLAGCWERAGSTGRTVEVWNSPSGGVLLGGSYFVTDSTIRELEQLRLWYSGDTLVYEAHPSSQSRTEFKAASPGTDEIVFENPTHDFPQRITYRRAGADSLIARIEGDRAGRRQPVTFAFTRARCSRVLLEVVRRIGKNGGDTVQHEWTAPARGWLKLVDALDARGSWEAAGASFRSAMTPEEWAEQLVAVRQPLGLLTSRALAVEQTLNGLPGEPPGEYVVQQYHTVYDGRQAVTETVTLLREANGDWRVVGYFIR